MNFITSNPSFVLRLIDYLQADCTPILVLHKSSILFKNFYDDFLLRDINGIELHNGLRDALQDI